jgi:lysophospholipase L1-like esterase
MGARFSIVVAAAAALVGLAVPASAPAAAAASGLQWTGAWATAEQWPFPGNDFLGPNWSVRGFDNQSVRQVVRVSTGGSWIRIRLSNSYGAGPLRVAGATIAKAGVGAATRAGTMRVLRFGHSSSTVIPAGRHTASDAVWLSTKPLESVTVTLYFAKPTGAATFHERGLTTTYEADGDHLFDRGGQAYAGETSHSWYYLSGVDVAGGPHPARGAVVAFGDSITDGANSTENANNRYPDELAERLVAAGRPLSVLNTGIIGNAVLTDSPPPCIGGEKALTRFSRDVLAQPGVRTVIVLEGINDIGTGGIDIGCGIPPVVTAAQLIEGHRTLIRAAHARGIKAVGATLLPMKGSAYGHYTPYNEGVRDALNHWIRTSGEYDAVVDLDRALADPADPDAMLHKYASFDNLHPNDAGMTAMAAAVNLATL